MGRVSPNTSMSLQKSLQQKLLGRASFALPQPPQHRSVQEAGQAITPKTVPHPAERSGISGVTARLQVSRCEWGSKTQMEIPQMNT